MGATETQYRVHRSDRHRQKLDRLCPGGRKPAAMASPFCTRKELFRELAVAQADGSIGRMLVRLAQVDVLLVDDFAMAPLKDSERRDFLEICDDRYQRRSLILTSQVPISHWHEQIGDATMADSILDRILHNAYRIELNGESVRKVLGRKRDEENGR
jgi:DNA replication protein DnaC